MFEVKYRGAAQVTHWQPTHAQPRPGVIEANSCLKQILSGPKQSSISVISVSPDAGLKCVDTNFKPPKVILSNSVYEIAHCGVDVSKPNYFTCIVGTKGENAFFFCHVFKCANKETAARITRTVANACTVAFQKHQRQKSTKGGPSPGRGRGRGRGRGGGPGRQPSMSRGGSAPGIPGVPRLTDSWFRPSMTRNEVNELLKTGRVGDFIVRESRTQPGNYAISVQKGDELWTSLISKTPRGYQLGTRSSVVFDELTEVIKYYVHNKFMNDAWGYPLTLRLPQDAAKPPAGGAGPAAGGSGMSRKPTYKNPPMFGKGGGGAPDVAGGAYMPECGWPESSEDEGDEDNFSFVPGGGMSEADAFEKIMNAGLDPSQGESALEAIMNAAIGISPDAEDEADGGLDNMGELDNALDALAQVDQETNDLGAGGDDDFNPRGGADPPAAETQTPMFRLTQHLFSQFAPDEDKCVSGQDIRPLLMKSGLDINALGTIWMEVDLERRGKIDFDQLGLILGLMSQAQQGQDISLETLDPDTASPPTLQGVEY